MKEKSTAQMVIGALMTGKNLNSRDISDIIIDREGRLIKVQDVASMLSKLNNTRRCDLGFFIKRVKKGNSFSYNIVEDALNLTEEQAYDLTLKPGKGRYTLDQAVADFPGLVKHLPPGRKAKLQVKDSKPKATSKPKAAAKPKKAASKAKSPAKPKTAPKAASKPKKAAKKVSVKPAAPAATVAKPALSNHDLDEVAKDIIQKILSELGNLDLNVKLNLDVEEIES